MKKYLLLILLSICLPVVAQTTRESVEAFRRDTDAYATAVDKIVKQKDFKGGINDLTVLIDKCEKERNYPSVRLASYYKCRGQGFLAMGEYADAEADTRQAVALLQTSGPEGKADLSDIWYQLSLIYYYWEKPEETIHSADECIESALDYYGPLHSTTLDAYSLRSNFRGFYNDRQGAMEDRSRCFGIIRNNIERNFTYLTTAERAAYWEKYRHETTEMFAFAHKLKERQSRFTDDLYDQQLLAKGLLLTAESALQRAIDGDPTLFAAYQKIRMLRKKAADARDPKEAGAAILEADGIERDLGTAASNLHRFMDFLMVRMEDVKSRLGKEDIAVEFVDYRVGKDSTMYAAIVLSPYWEHACFLPLIEQKEIDARRDDLADCIWKPVLDCLEIIPRNIYFSPSGRLYTIPIESLSLSDGRLMCENFHMFRMSSTRWLTYDSGMDTGRDAVIYGGLDYDLPVDDLIADAGKYRNLNYLAELGRDRADRGLVSSLRYLPGTLAEAENISESIQHAGREDLSVRLYTGREGTEASFKSLDGQKIKVIHLATHGFFSSETSDPMTGSGLCFAGAGNAYRQASVSSAADGILTAQEISEMDLRGLDLVVLSACQTGMGEITADGVQGLQRGFKKAGGKSMVMSLWNVDDKATQLLMSAFYRELLSGKSKMEAFEDAKRELRHTPPFSDMKYWGAFVMLDACENNAFQ